ncbi:MAG: nickel-binding protein, partial [Rhodomicrobium sp.]
MPKFIIEREISGAGNLKPQELQAISQKSYSVLRNLGPQIQWLHS